VSGLGSLFMKIWTSGSFPRSGSRNAGKRIKNVNDASRLSKIWNFFGRRYTNDFLSGLVTMDETWLYRYDSETKQQSREWRHSGSPHPKKSVSKNPWKNSRLELFRIKTEFFSLIIFQRTKLSTWNIAHLCCCI